VSDGFVQSLRGDMNDMFDALGIEPGDLTGAQGMWRDCNTLAFSSSVN
jgi:hypothetical protein